MAACQRGLRVRYTTAAQLVNELAEAADERMLSRMVARYGRLERWGQNGLSFPHRRRRWAKGARAEAEALRDATLAALGSHPPPGTRPACRASRTSASRPRCCTSGLVPTLRTGRCSPTIRCACYGPDATTVSSSASASPHPTWPTRSASWAGPTRPPQKRGPPAAPRRGARPRRAGARGPGSATAPASTGAGRSASLRTGRRTGHGRRRSPRSRTVRAHRNDAAPHGGVMRALAAPPRCSRARHRAAASRLRYTRRRGGGRRSHGPRGTPPGPRPGKQTWTARPECESRTTNIESSVSTPSNQTLTQPKSTSASSPGGCSWGIVTATLPDARGAKEVIDGTDRH